MIIKKEIVVTFLGLFIALIRVAFFAVPEQILLDPTSDFNVYLRALDSISDIGFLQYIQEGRFEPGFLAILFTFSKLGMPLETLSGVIVFLLTFSFLKLCEAVGVKLHFAVVFSVFFAFSPLVGSFASVAMRQGLALAFILWGGALSIKRHKWLFLLFSLIAVSLHASSLVFLCAFLLARARNFDRMLAVFLPIVMLAYALSLFSTHFSFFGDMLRLLAGFSQELRYEVGFKLNFLLAGVVFVIPFYTNCLLGKRNERFSIISRWVILLIIFYMMVSNMPYYDRFATTSWILGLICWAFFISQFVLRGKVVVNRG